MRIVRERMGLTNVELLIPFVRTVAEGRRVIELMEEQGLARGDGGLKVHIMCEIPSNSLLAEEFLDICDGFSIGSNDLCQLALGVDRDSGLLQGYDERDPAVLRLMALAIDAAVRKGKYVGICGQAPSDFPEITRWLVERGIGCGSKTTWLHAETPPPVVVVGGDDVATLLGEEEEASM